MKGKHYIFFWWTISFILGTTLFIFNPLFAIFCAIVMLPIFMHDILVKIFVEKIYEAYQQ